MIEFRIWSAMDCSVGCPGPIEKIFYLLENYLKILACSQVIDRCPLGYLSMLLHFKGFENLFYRYIAILYFLLLESIQYNTDTCIKSVILTQGRHVLVPPTQKTPIRQVNPCLTERNDDVIHPTRSGSKTSRQNTVFRRRPFSCTPDREIRCFTLC